MARNFDGAATEILSGSWGGASNVTTLTMACWVDLDSEPASYGVMSVADASTTNNYHAILHSNTVTSGSIAAATFTSAGFVASIGGFGALSGVTHLAGVWSGTSSRTIYADGVIGTPESSTRTPSGVDTVSIGNSADSTPVGAMNGRAMWPCVWDIALTTAEIAQLAAGVHPYLIHPESILHFWGDMHGTGTETDLIGAGDLTETGTIESAETVVLLPLGGPRFVVSEIAAAGGTTPPLFYHHSHHNRAA